MANNNEIERRRTFAIIAHPDAGKTSLTEKLLLFGGQIQVAGAVKSNKIKKTATSDWMDIEKQRGISVTSSVLQFNYAGKCVNILDTPGHQDFSEDTYRTLMAADSAVMVIDAAKGVEAQTIKLFKVCTLRHIPIFTFINKMDREARDPFELMENIEEILGIKTYPMNWPIGCGKEFKGVFDRNTRKVLAFSSDGRANGVKKVEETEAELGDAALDELLGGEQPSSALILGTGGASQAVQYVLAERGIPFDLVSRDTAKGNYTYDDLPCEVVERSRLIVNASPVGTYPNVDAAPRIPYAYVTPEHYLLDLVYNPPLTQFLDYGRQRGAHILNGRTMFVEQAEASWRIWNA